MKKLIVLTALLMPSIAHADLIHKMTSSTQLTVDGAYTIAERGASTYSVSGSNIKVASADDHFGKLVAPASATAAATLDAGTYDVNTAGSAFSFQESFIGGDAAYAVGSGVDVSAGVIPDLPCLLYTSDAADDTPCVDLGGRRIIKKKTYRTVSYTHLRAHET